MRADSSYDVDEAYKMQYAEGIESSSVNILLHSIF